MDDAAHRFRGFIMNLPFSSSRPADLTAEQEARRLAAVRRYHILDTPPDGSFDRITALAADLFDVPIAIVSLVDHDRIWFKSHHGLEVEQIDRGPGLCASAILQDGPWVLTDAKTDVRALTNPLVAGEFGLRFYVGVPLRTSDGHNLGTLCVIDRAPRTVNERQIERLKHLAAMVMDQMELRLAARRAVAKLSRVVEEKDAALRCADMMAKEIDHRVMNSLQLISGLLRLHSRELGQSDAGHELGVAAQRVTTIAKIHQHIYLGDGIEYAECKSYLERLCDDLSAMLRTVQRAPIAVQAVEARVPTAQIVAIGLIVNELVINSLKHGKGQVRVTLEGCAEDGYALSVSDEGMGVPEGFDPADAKGLGMKVVSAQVQQLRGRLEVGAAEGSEGAKFTVFFGGPDRQALN
jgi:two-component sensor histidine kinase